ncbi:MAG: hypothetical protein EOO01_39850, partial [Chitinophagaceae bacterium]
MPDSLKMEYYQVMGRFYYDLADFGNDSYHTPGYVQKGNQFLDSALRFFDPGSFPYHYFRGLKDIRSGNNMNALEIYRRLMENPSLTNHEIALTASTLSDIYIQKGENDTAIALLIKAAIADIYSSTKETAAAFNLANLLYKKGDVKNASLCIQLAISDATFYGARQRKVKVSDILPLIESEKLSLVEKQKKTLITYAIVVTLLLLGVVVLIVVVLRQVKKLEVEDCALQVLAHEIGHHIYTPANLHDNAILLSRIQWGLAGIENRTAFIANIYADFLINDMLQRSKGLDMAKVYQKINKDTEFSRLWTLVMRSYEYLWRLNRG